MENWNSKYKWGHFGEWFCGLGNDFVECGANNIHKCKNILKYLFEISNELLSLHLQIICPYFR